MEAIHSLPVSPPPIQGILQQQAASGDQNFLFHQVYQQIDTSVKSNALIDILPTLPEQLMPWNKGLEQPSESDGGQPFFSGTSFTPAVMHLNTAPYPDVASSVIGPALSAQMSLRGSGSVRLGTVSQHQTSPEVTELINGRDEQHRAISDTSSQVILPGNGLKYLPQSLFRDSDSEPLPFDRKYFVGNSKTLTANHGAVLENDTFIQNEQRPGLIDKVANSVRPEAHFLIDQVTVREQLPLMSQVTEAEPIHANQASHTVKQNISASVESRTESLQQKAISGSYREVAFPQSVFPQRLGTEVIQMLRKGEAGLEIRLDPPELGRLSLSVSLEAESLSLQVTASSAMTRDLLLNQVDRLRQVLAEQNMDFSELSVDVHSGQGGQAGRHQATEAAASETLLLADWGSENPEYLSGAQLFRSRGGRLLDHFV